LKKFIILSAIIFFLIFTENGRVILIKCALHTTNLLITDIKVNVENITSKKITNFACKKITIELKNGPKISVENAVIKIGETFFIGAKFLDLDLNKTIDEKNSISNYQDFDVAKILKKYHQGLYILHEKIDTIIPQVQIKYNNKIYFGAINFEHTPFEQNLGRSYINFTQDKNFSLNYESTYSTKVSNDFNLNLKLNLDYADNQISLSSKYETNHNSNKFALKDLDVFHNKNQIMHGNIEFSDKNLKANLDIKNANVNRLFNKPKTEKNQLLVSASIKHQGPIAISGLSGELAIQVNKTKSLFKLKSTIKDVLNLETFFNNESLGTIVLRVIDEQLTISTKLKNFHHLMSDFIIAKSSLLQSDISYHITNKLWQIEKCQLDIGAFKFTNLDFMTFDKFTASLAKENESLKLIATIEDFGSILRLSGTSLIRDNIWKHDYAINTSKFVLTNKNNIHIPLYGDLKFSGEDSNLLLTGDIGINSGKIKKIDLLNFSSIPKIKITNIEKEDNSKFKINSNITIKINENFTIESKNLIAILKGKALITGNLFSPEIASEISISDGSFNILNKKFEFKKSKIFAASNNIYLLMIAHYSDSEYEYIVEISGELGQNLTIDFSSIPSMPKNKIIPRLILGNDLNKMSPFEAILILNKLLNIESEKDISDYLNVFKLEDFKVIQEDGAVKVKITKKIIDDILISIEGGTGEKTGKMISIEKIFSEKISSYLKSSTENSLILGAKLRKFYD